LPRKSNASDSDELNINIIDNEVWSSQKSFIATIYRYLRPMEFGRISNEKTITSLLGGAAT